jgi:hypothetical protein
MRITVNLQDVYQIVTAAKQISEIQARRAQEIARDVAQQTYGKAMEMASDRLKSTKQTYIDNLDYDEGDGLYTITLKADAAHLELGYGSFDMKKGMLDSKAIVQVGKRAGQPWVQRGKSGYRYAAVPFTHGPEGAAKPGHPEYNRKIQIGKPTQTTKGSLMQDLKALKEAFGVQQIFNSQGDYITGKAWSITKSVMGPQWTYQDVTGRKQTKTIQANPLLSGLTGIQWQQKKRGGGFTNRTANLTWRMVSENPMAKSKFIHPGFRGIQAFPDLERYVIQTFMQRLQE